MGDASASAQLHGMTARAGVDHLGFSALYRGEATIGCGRVVDRGYVDHGRGVRASTRRNNNPTVEAWCAQVLNGFPFTLSTKILYRMMCFSCILFARESSTFSTTL